MGVCWSTCLEGDYGAIGALDLGVDEPASLLPRQCASTTKVEVAIRVDVFCPVSIGIGKDNRWDLAGLHALKEVTEPSIWVTELGDELAIQLNRSDFR